MLLSLFFISCEKTVEDRLPGNWQYSLLVDTEVTYNGNTSTQSDSEGGTAIFEEDGTGQFIVGSDTNNCTWTTTDVLVELLFENDTLSMEIITNEKDRQEYKQSVTETGTNYSFTTVSTLNLSQ